MSGSIVPLEVFCSYTDTDEPLLGKLKAHLSGLERQGLISTWHARQIPPGTDKETIPIVVEGEGWPRGCIVEDSTDINPFHWNK